jgi:hypothetical protein
MNLQTVWDFVSDSKNRKIITWLCSGLAVAIAGVWGAVVYVFPHDKPAPSSITTTGPQSPINKDIGGNVTQTFEAPKSEAPKRTAK